MESGAQCVTQAGGTLMLIQSVKAFRFLVSIIVGIKLSEPHTIQNYDRTSRGTGLRR